MEGSSPIDLMYQLEELRKKKFINSTTRRGSQSLKMIWKSEEEGGGEPGGRKMLGT